MTRFDLNELLATADIVVVSLHLPLTPDTCNLLDARRIGLMKRGATLVNCARGGLIDETALNPALEKGTIHAAALDNFAQEPPVGSPLLGRDDVVVTPTSPARPTTISSSSCAAASTTFIASLRASRSRQQRWSSFRTMAARLGMS